MRLTYIIFVLFFLKSTAFAQTALQLKVINDPNDTINIELKERYAITQSMLKLFAAVNTNNKQQFLNLLSEDYKKNDLSDLFYFSDTLELTKSVPPWKKFIILISRFEYKLNPSRAIALIDLFDPYFFYKIWSAKKPINITADKIFAKIELDNDIGKHSNNDGDTPLEFVKEKGIWKMSLLPGISSVFKAAYKERASSGASIDSYSADFDGFSVKDTNEEIFKILEKEYSIKISKDLWKPLKEKPKTNEKILEVPEQKNGELSKQKHEIKISKSL